MLSTFATILLVLFIPICILLILIVLLQAGKGGGLAGAFGGGGGGQTFLGARGAADFLSKLTIYLAIGFMCLSLILSLTYGKNRGGGDMPTPEESGVPAGDAAQGEVSGDADQSQSPPADEGSEAASTETEN